MNTRQSKRYLYFESSRDKKYYVKDFFSGITTDYRSIPTDADVDPFELSETEFDEGCEEIIEAFIHERKTTSRELQE